MSPRVLHVIAVVGPGGGCRAALGGARAASAHLEGAEQRFVSLRPAEAKMRAVIEGEGFEVLDAVPRTEVLRAIAEADLVHLHHWNSPEMLELLELELPPARLLVWAHVSGSTVPQLFPPGLGEWTDLAIATSKRCAQALGASLEIPPVGGWERVEGVRRSGRPGFNIGNVGTVGFSKLHPDFAEMCAGISIPDAHYNVCGDGPSTRRLRLQADALGLGGRLELTGRVDDIGAVMADCDVFGYPLGRGTYASSDLVLKEAMYCGVPPVVLVDGGSEFLVEDGVTGVVANGPDDYGPAIEALHADPAERRRLGENAREHAARAWGFGAVGPRWADAYRGLLDDPKALRPPLLAGPGDHPGARRFLVGMGAELSDAVDPADEQAAVAADRLIARGHPTVGFNDGGLFDYRRRNPEDELIALWCGLFLREQGRSALAEAELVRARALGCPEWRLEAHRAEAVLG
jgi:hypothetical protein